ncbi:MAG: hypothetical protein IPN14_08295 [Bacteroidetes bacterium]|nr:hypothetical protein [Bacteroidota bacterium]
MAEGCNLYFTEKDLIDVEESINNLKVNISPSKFASNALSAIIQRSPNSIIKSLQDSNDSKNELLKGLIFTSLNANKLHSSDKEKLIDSLIVVLKYEKNPIGLFSNPPKYRGPGADSMKHGGELLTIGAIINNSDLEDPINPKLGFTSLSGKNLFYNYKTDKVAFGQKFASNYSLSTRKKGTIEADTLISREIKDDFLGSTFF